MARPKKKAAKVEFGLGFTVNLGGFESARMDAKVTLEGDESELDDLWAKAEGEVQKQINRNIESIQTHYDAEATLLGLPKVEFVKR